MFELVWVMGVMHALEARILSASWTDVLMSLPHFKKRKRSKKQLQKEKRLKHHKKMHRRAVRHLKHMQKVQEAIREHRRAQNKVAVAVSGGVGIVNPGEGINQDIASQLGAARQKLQQRLHEAVRPKDTAVQQQLNALRHRTHASRVRAQARSAAVFGRG